MLVYTKKKKNEKQSFSIRGIHEFILTNPDGSIKKRFVKENLIVDVGLGMVGQILAGIAPGDGEINYCALGTGSASISASDTVLENEGVRKIRGARQSSGPSFIVAFYLNPTEGNGTWTRYGTFIDGTATEDSGTLFTHLVVDITKSSGEGLTINSQYTLTSV